METHFSISILAAPVSFPLGRLEELWFWERLCLRIQSGIGSSGICPVLSPHLTVHLQDPCVGPSCPPVDNSHHRRRGIKMGTDPHTQLMRQSPAIRRQKEMENCFGSPPPWLLLLRGILSTFRRISHLRLSSMNQTMPPQRRTH